MEIPEQKSLQFAGHTAERHPVSATVIGGLWRVTGPDVMGLYEAFTREISPGALHIMGGATVMSDIETRATRLEVADVYPAADVLGRLGVTGTELQPPALLVNGHALRVESARSPIDDQHPLSPV